MLHWLALNLSEAPSFHSSHVSVSTWVSHPASLSRSLRGSREKKSRDHVIVSSGWLSYQAGRVEGGDKGTRRRTAHCTQRRMKPPTVVITCWGINSATSPATHQANAAVNPACILRRLQSVNNDATNRSEGRCGSRYIPLPRTGRLTHMVFKLGGWLALTRRIDGPELAHHSVLAIQAMQHMR